MPLDMKYAALLAFLLLACTESQAQDRPKLVIGIVVDQMRMDYLHQYESLYGKQGFKKLQAEGSAFYDCKFDYFPTYTAPGHTAVYTGAPPSISGIVANNWYERSEQQSVYCASDEGQVTLGGTPKAGQFSPHRLLCTTLGDELKIATRGHGRVISVALKDRSAILPAGHTADAAYWFDDRTGNFVTNQFYMQVLPQWVTRFNEEERAEAYLKQLWTPLLDPKAYQGLAAPDNSPGEGLLPSTNQSTFPYSLPEIREKGGVRVIQTTPFGSTFTTDFALEAMQQEQLGKGTHTDMMLISYSSPDYMGHLFGPHSLEIADCYVRLDLEIERLLAYVGKEFKRNEVLVFLTADHGAAQAPQWLSSLGIPSRVLDQAIGERMKEKMKQQYGQPLIEYFVNRQFYIDRKAVAQAGLDLCEVQTFLANCLLDEPGVATTATACDLRRFGYSDPIFSRLKAGFYPKRSGDVFFVDDPGIIDMDWSRAGTTHGTVYSFDTQVPLLFWGHGVPKGKRSTAPVNITDVAPTVAWLMRIGQPSGCIGRVLLD